MAQFKASLKDTIFAIIRLNESMYIEDLKLIFTKINDKWMLRLLWKLQNKDLITFSASYNETKRKNVKNLCGKVWLKSDYQSYHLPKNIFMNY